MISGKWHLIIKPIIVKDICSRNHVWIKIIFIIICLNGRYRNNWQKFLNRLRPLFYLFSSGCHFLAYRCWMLPRGVLEWSNHRSWQLKVANFKIFTQNLYIRWNLINFSSLSLIFFNAFFFHYRRVIFVNSEFLYGSGVGMNWNLVATRYPSVPIIFYLAGTRYPTRPKKFFWLGTQYF